MNKLKAIWQIILADDFVVMSMKHLQFNTVYTNNKSRIVQMFNFFKILYLPLFEESETT